MITGPGELVDFWKAAGRKAWFSKTPEFDAQVRSRFGPEHSIASAALQELWTRSPEGALGFVILCDQVPRNIFRESAQAFSTDALARSAADRALSQGFDQAVEAELRPFFYLPFEHHEDARAQARSLELFTRHTQATGDADWLRYAELHAGLIERFGRFPHRNLLLDRASTPEELEYLAGPGFKG